MKHYRLVLPVAMIAIAAQFVHVLDQPTRLATRFAKHCFVLMFCHPSPLSISPTPGVTGRKWANCSRKQVEVKSSSRQSARWCHAPRR